MFDARPRLIPKPRPRPSKTPRSYTQHREQKLAKFERWLAKHPDALERQHEILPYFRAMLASGIIRCRPVRFVHQRWIFDQTDRERAVRELFRLAYKQHSPSVVWPPLAQS